MKLQFKQQDFQTDAAKAVCDVFEGQPRLTPTFLFDPGKDPDHGQTHMEKRTPLTGWCNQPIVPGLSDRIILENLHRVQRAGGIPLSPSLSGSYNLTVEMETGVGKTFTYIQTMYELNARYGWSKFIVVVPSVAIREGVYKSFELTRDYFMGKYKKKIRYFIYNSSQLDEIDRFATDNAICVMIINSQAFNAKGKEARRIYMELDDFRSRRPIDIIAGTNPILIIDEPQSVEGTATKTRLKEFRPLMTLRYSATHKKGSEYDMVYRLDAMEAYNKMLVKKIAVKGISLSGSTATDGYVYLEDINLSERDPTATIEFDRRGKSGVYKMRRVVKAGDSLYDLSKGLGEYQNGYVITDINGRDGYLELSGGTVLQAGEALGAVSKEHLRRLQIRETILSHLGREELLFYKGIKVLSLFFIDHVANYRLYDEGGQPQPGSYAAMFEEEYRLLVEDWLKTHEDDAYCRYLRGISGESTHAGYFSVDKKSNRLVDSKLEDKKERISDDKEQISDDKDAYDLIMKDKERLLDRAEPVRFLFSHSALREGWDNPNVFQICTLKQSSSEMRKRQEVGRGLRLSVNQDGERMDKNLLKDEVHSVNVLTVIASESYEAFAKGLQDEIAKAVAHRPSRVTPALFEHKVLKDAAGQEHPVDDRFASIIYEELCASGYIRGGALTEQYYKDKRDGTIDLDGDIAQYQSAIVAILDTLYNADALKPDNARGSGIVKLKLRKDLLDSSSFQEFWQKVNAKTVYSVDFDTDELILNATEYLNRKLLVPKILFKIESGEMERINSREELEAGESFRKRPSTRKESGISANAGIRYDLIGSLVNDTGLTRETVARILKGLKKTVFDQFKENPEDFILKAAKLINEQKAVAIVEHITYHKTGEVFDASVFTTAAMSGKLGDNAVPAKHHLYSHVLCDSKNERKFVESLEVEEDEVAWYVKLPRGYYIDTPMGRYHPDWMILLKAAKVKHPYFIAETKGSMSTLQNRRIEEAKIQCAYRHFQAICPEGLVYEVVDSYDALIDMANR